MLLHVLRRGVLDIWPRLCAANFGLAGSAYAVPSNGMIAYVGDGGLQVISARTARTRGRCSPRPGAVPGHGSPRWELLALSDLRQAPALELRTALGIGTERPLVSGYRGPCRLGGRTRSVSLTLGSSKACPRYRSARSARTVVGTRPVIVEPGTSCVFPEFGAGIFWSPATNQDHVHLRRGPDRHRSRRDQPRSCWARSTTRWTSSMPSTCGTTAPRSRAGPRRRSALLAVLGRSADRSSDDRRWLPTLQRP